MPSPGASPEGEKRMAEEQLADWPRKFYQGSGGKPFLFYVVFGAFSRMHRRV